MANDVRVELVARQASVSAEARAALAAASRDVDDAKASGDDTRVGEALAAYETVEADCNRPGWVALINGVEVPVLDYAVSHGETGPVVNLVFPVSALTVDTTAGSTATPATPEPQKPVVPWGAPGRRDPREGIPGWVPEQVAVSFSSEHLDSSLLDTMRRRINDRFDGGAVAVTA